VTASLIACIKTNVLDKNQLAFNIIQYNTIQQLFVLRSLQVDCRTMHTAVQELLFSDTPYDEVNRNMFSLSLNSAIDRHSFDFVGSCFHTRGAATEKHVLRFQAWSPNREVAMSRRSECRPSGDFCDRRQ